VTAFTAAAATGYLRTAARRHWLTDVSVGALVGTGTTCLTYWMQP
jgi:membrane-associated phospholipid phosphatase